jgi:hypothetical protein
MAGDLNVTERAVLESGQPRAEGGQPSPGGAMHRYGRVGIVEVADEAGAAALHRPLAPGAEPEDLSEVERLGLAAFRLRSRVSTSRPRATGRAPVRTGTCPTAPRWCPCPGATEARDAGAPTSAYLEGTVAVGVVIVQGPTPDLRFSDAERTKVVAEVQNGLTFLSTANPLAGITFTYDIQNVTLATAPDPNAADLEAHWRNPAMGAIGFSADWAGVGAYVEDLPPRFGTRWTYCVLFTKYAVAQGAGGRLVRPGRARRAHLRVRRRRLAGGEPPAVPRRHDR